MEYLRVSRVTLNETLKMLYAHLNRCRWKAISIKSLPSSMDQFIIFNKNFNTTKWWVSVRITNKIQRKFKINTIKKYNRVVVHIFFKESELRNFEALNEKGEKKCLHSQDETHHADLAICFLVNYLSIVHIKMDHYSRFFNIPPFSLEKELLWQTNENISPHVFVIATCIWSENSIYLFVSCNKQTFSWVFETRHLHAPYTFRARAREEKKKSAATKTMSCLRVEHRRLLITFYQEVCGRFRSNTCCDDENVRVDDDISLPEQHFFPNAMWK